jgi:hypothetical protein
MPYRIDFHRHVIPGVYLEAMGQAGLRHPLQGWPTRAVRSAPTST